MPPTNSNDPITNLTPSAVAAAHAKIKPYIHHTPLLTNRSLDVIASSPNPRAFLSDDPPAATHPHTTASALTSMNGLDSTPPRFNLYFKCENHQKIGAFKARGAHHALLQLISRLGKDEVCRRGVITHSSGNHAQALALAARTFGVPSTIVMPRISTPSKIAGTKAYATRVVFSGSTSSEREAVVAELQKEGGMILVPPYDHEDIILGQGTAGLEMEGQFAEIKRAERVAGTINGTEGQSKSGREEEPHFDAVLTPLGGGGLLSGTATHFSHTHTGGGKKTLIFGTEPSYQGANDAELGLQQGERIEHVSTLTIADGLRTPVGEIPWSIISDKSKVEGVYSVSEEEIKMALRLIMERAKIFVEPSAAVPLAVVLFCEGFRGEIAELQRREKEGTGREKAWDVGIVLSGGNTTVAALSKMFGEREEEKQREREAGLVGADGRREVEDVAG